MRKAVAPSDEILAEQYVQELRAGQYDKIEPFLDPSIVDASIHETLVKMTGLFPAGEPLTIKPVGVHRHRSAAVSESDITLEYQFQDHWLLVTVGTQTKGGVLTITGLHVTPVADSLENLNRFTLARKSAAQYLVLAVTGASLIFSLCVFVLAIRTRGVKLKWLWVICTLVGVSKIAINWSTGEITYTLLAVQIPCFSANHPPYSPWTVAAYFPLGAFLFLNQRWLMRIRGESIPLLPDAPQKSASVS
jgi:hypothetical protein